MKSLFILLTIICVTLPCRIIRELLYFGHKAHRKHQTYRQWENDVPETVKLVPVWARRTWRITKKLFFSGFIVFCLTLR